MLSIPSSKMRKEDFDFDFFGLFAWISVFLHHINHNFLTRKSLKSWISSEEVADKYNVQFVKQKHSAKLSTSLFQLDQICTYGTSEIL